MAWRKADKPLTAREEFEALTLDDLRPLARLITDDPPKKKTELVPFLTRAMTDSDRVRALYDGLGPLSQEAVRLATADAAGRLVVEQFRARSGEQPRFDTADPNREQWEYRYAELRKISPTPLRLFFPRHDALPTDVRAILRKFVPAPEPFAVPTVDAPPETHVLHAPSWDRTPGREQSAEPVRVRETAGEAAADVEAVLRLIDVGKVRVTDKKLIPTEASRGVVAGVLSGGDFYSPDEADDWETDPAADLTIKAFAWPVLVQTGGLAEKRGDALRLTAAGKRAMTTKPPEALRRLWTQWLKARQFDEFARVEAIKGQGKARMSAVAGRRQAVADALATVPVGRWFSVGDFFRLMRATGRDFTLVHDEIDLYIAEQQYGSLGCDDGNAWEQLQGRFVLAFLFETAATLGLIDVAYVPPQGVRHDFRDRWGADDFTCLSRYDGLLDLRVNPLGAWLLGRADAYRPSAPTRVERVRVLSNLDVVAAVMLPAADCLTLERFADPESDRVWKLSAGKILGVVESGGSIDELEQFLATRAAADIPANVAAFLADLRAKAGRLADAGPARLIACADEHVAAELAADRQLKGKCLRAGDRYVVVRDSDLDAARKAARRLGYLWPIPPG
jgi:hypothetical protein